MKKFITGLFCTLLAFGSTYAQLDDKDAKRYVRDARKALNEYRLSTQDKIQKLDEAKELIDLALKNEEMAVQADSWITKGDIYSELTRRDEAQSLVNPEWENQGLNTSLIASQAFHRALKHAEKNSESRDALQGLADCVSDLNNLGITYFQAKDYMNAYQSFSEMINIHRTLKENGEASPFDEEDKYNSTKYVTALAAMNAGQYDVANSMFSELRSVNYDDPAVYESLHKIAVHNEDMAAAEQYLSEGREKYPDDTGLLFAEINHYLREGRMGELVSKLETAIEKEPDNLSLYTTMGSVYDNLYQEASKQSEEGAAPAEGENMADEYFDKALEYFQKALEIDERNPVALYSIGALYYNKAALLTVDLNEIADDYSKEGTEKYEELKTEIESIFDLALPYFQKSETIDPNDRNTLIALKEIYARKNEFDLSNEFKMRLDKLDAGETNEKSYFNND
jgi:tetratricopeptide (TPR) repeat protein